MGRRSTIDLHCHTTASDGTLSPAEVVQRAADNGVRLLAVTDHDTVAGLAEAAGRAESLPLRLLPGVELSVTHDGHTLHVVGLGVDPGAPVLSALLETLQEERRERARRMAGKLAAIGIADAWERVRSAAGEGAVTRGHFADLLVETGHARSRDDAFRHYLRRGRRAYAAARWCTMERTVGAIRAAGGVAVLAHPAQYPLSGRGLGRAVDAFAAAGGEALEVVTGSGGKAAVSRCAAHARRLGLEGSVGSDFHTPGNPWLDLGRLDPLPEGIAPVWRRWIDG